MKKQNIVLTVKLLLIILAIVGSVECMGAKKMNEFRTSSLPITLQYWKITKDPTPDKPLNIIPDSLWNPLSKSNFTEIAEGNWVLSTSLIIDNDKQNISLGISATGFVTAYEIYWDDKLIVTNGSIALNSDNEKPGLYSFHSIIPANLTTPGEHKVTLRLSNHSVNSLWKWYYGDIQLGAYQDLIKVQYHHSFQSFLFIGLLFIPFLFNLFLYITRNRKTEHLIFSLLCFLVLVDTTLSLIPLLTEARTTFYTIEYFGYRALTLVVSGLFPAFFIYHFGLNKKYIIPILTFQVVLFLYFLSDVRLYQIMTMSLLVVTTLISIFALIKRLNESVVIFAGIIIAWIAYFFNFAFLGLTSVMVISVSFSIAKQFGKQEKAIMDAKLQSANLENELLKKNISPHFLLNSLTSIIVWLRKDPNTAIKLILALADEFRMVTQISGLKQITIEQEIELCNAHLKIMSYRKGAKFQLETVDLDTKAMIPPMVFHTLIENGITHGYEVKESGLFVISRVIEDNAVKYIIRNDGEFLSNESAASTGFGLKYIKGRLEESYPSKWILSSQMINGGWESIIEIKA